jgi:glycosyltransferase involved in cell wall biosynthesis
MSGRQLSVVILTRDEEANLRVALQSLRPLDAAVFVVDSGSRDGTVELAREMGCHVAHRPWTNYAEQFAWALETLPIETPWVMRLDADERLTPELADELREVLPHAEGVGGFQVNRRVHFWGRWIKHGGYYPTWLLRVWRRGQARIESRWMDEHMVLAPGAGATKRLRHDLIDENNKGLSFWVDKHNRYADREVKDMLAIEADRERIEVTGQAGQRRWLKANVYARAPLFARAFAYWSFRYFARLGFLDGVPGLVFHFNQGLWYRLLVDAKLYERQRSATERPPGA